MKATSPAIQAILEQIALHAKVIASRADNAAYNADTEDEAIGVLMGTELEIEAIKALYDAAIAVHRTARN